MIGTSEVLGVEGRGVRRGRQVPDGFQIGFASGGRSFQRKDAPKTIWHRTNKVPPTLELWRSLSESVERFEQSKPIGLPLFGKPHH